MLKPVSRFPSLIILRQQNINMAEHHVREYVKRVASVDLENYPEWDLTVSDLGNSNNTCAFICLRFFYQYMEYQNEILMFQTWQIFLSYPP